MNKVTPIGYFRELQHGLSNGPSLKASIGRGQDYCQEKLYLLSYLSSGVPYIVSPGVGMDVIRNDGTVSGSIHTLTDGVWIWPADLAYYVDKYDVDLPDKFLSHARDQKWKVPDAESIDLSLIEVDV